MQEKCEINMRSDKAHQKRKSLNFNLPFKYIFRFRLNSHFLKVVAWKN